VARHWLVASVQLGVDPLLEGGLRSVQHGADEIGLHLGAEEVVEILSRRLG
jgi:hypothetical protein